MYSPYILKRGRDLTFWLHIYLFVPSLKMHEILVFIIEYSTRLFVGQVRSGQHYWKKSDIHFIFNSKIAQSNR